MGKSKKREPYETDGVPKTKIVRRMYEHEYDSEPPLYTIGKSAKPYENDKEWYDFE